MDSTTLLSEDQVAEAGLAGWQVRDGALVATYETGDFATGLRLVNAVGAAAEEANHHPDLTLTYPRVSVLLTSHDVGGLTQRDVDLARRTDALASDLGVVAEGRPTGEPGEPGESEPKVGDAPEPLARGRSENPPPDGVGYDGSPVEEIQRDRAERLAPENRPENAEVDNSGRVFDVEKAMFTDEEGYEDAPKKFPPAEEQGA